MAIATLQTINPESGVYAITFQDPVFNPDTKIVEGTTGNKYASTYMGARSRWWDLSMAQAQIEQRGVDQHNKRIQQEILNLQDARANIIQGVPQRYDTMYKHHNTQYQMRKEFNASSGDLWSTTQPGKTTTISKRPSGYGARAGPGAKGAYYVRRDVQGLTANTSDPTARAGALNAGRTSGLLGKDEDSQDQAAWYAVGFDIETSYNNKVNAGMDPAQAAAEAEGETLLSYDAADPEGQALGARWRKVNDQVKGQFVTTTTREAEPTKGERKGKKKIAEYYDPKTHINTALPWTIDPFAYDEQKELTELEQEILEKEQELKPAVDLIDRARQVQREKFGPSILQNIMEQIGQPPYHLRRGSTQYQTQKALEDYLARGGSLEGLREITGYTPPVSAVGAPTVPEEVAAKTPEDVVKGNVVGYIPAKDKSTWLLKDGSVVVLNRREVGDVGEVTGYKAGQKVKQSQAEGGYSWTINEVSEDGQTITGATFHGESKDTPINKKSTLDGLMADVDSQKIVISKEQTGDKRNEREAYHYKEGKATKYLSPAEGQPFVVTDEGAMALPEGIPKPDAEVWLRDVEKFNIMERPGIEEVIPKEEMERAGRPDVLEPRIIPEEPKEEVEEPYIPAPDAFMREAEEAIRPSALPPIEEELPPIEEEELPPGIEGGASIEKTGDPLAARGSPKIQAHNKNLLGGFVGAQKLLDKPKQLERQVANASTGSPQQFARTTMDAWANKDPSQRETLSELVANIAQQYTMYDPAQRKKALEYTIALYQLETEAGMLT